MIRRPKEMTIEQVYEQIVNYARDRIGGIGGYWGQEPYKVEFFQIFYSAYYNGWCGRKRYSRSNRNKRLEVRKFIVTGEFLEDHLRTHWLNETEPTELQSSLIRDLHIWWDEWTYAWDLHPKQLPRKYIRRRR